MPDKDWSFRLRGKAQASWERGSTRRWRRSAIRPLVIAVVYLLAWGLLDLLSSRFEVAQEVRVWYPPTGLDMLLLLVFGLRYSPLLALNTLVHAGLSKPDLSIGQLTILAAITTSSYACAAWVLLRRLRIDPRLTRQSDVIWLVLVAALAAPLAVAIGQVLVFSATGLLPWSSFATNALSHWAGDSTGVGMLTPFLLVALRPFRALWWDGGAGSHARLGKPWPSWSFESGAELLLFALALWAAYGPPSKGTLNYTFFVYLPLVWVAVRHGFARASLVVLMLNVSVTALVAAQSLKPTVAPLQFGLMTFTLVGLLLGAIVTQRRKDEIQLAHQSLHDPLTGLPNRALFLDRLVQAHCRAERDDKRGLAVLLVDIDHFKAVNDSLGHRVGDQLLMAVAERLRAQLRPSDAIARFGGDEFALLVADLCMVTDVAHVAERVLKALGGPHHLEGQEIYAPASVGVVYEPGCAHSPEELIQAADTALHRAKAEGRGRWVLYDEAMRAEVIAALQLEVGLRRSVEACDFSLVYQPIVEVGSGKLVGVEALVRWSHPALGPVGPGRFIPIAERTGLIRPLGAAVLRAACAQARVWQHEGASRLRLAVNVSVRQLTDADFADEVLSVLADTGLGYQHLELEVTESVWMLGAEVAADNLRVLADEGISIVVDDFGTGYSSLSYLRSYPMQGLKIDRSFVTRVPRAADDVVLVQTILAMADNLGLEVTAEGVETVEQLTLLQALGCPRAQGFWWGQPRPPGPLSSLVANAPFPGEDPTSKRRPPAVGAIGLGCPPP